MRFTYSRISTIQQVLMKIKHQHGNTLELQPSPCNILQQKVLQHTQTWEGARKKTVTLVIIILFSAAILAASITKQILLPSHSSNNQNVFLFHFSNNHRFINIYLAAADDEAQRLSKPIRYRLWRIQLQAHNRMFLNQSCLIGKWVNTGDQTNAQRYNSRKQANSGSEKQDHAQGNS